MHCVDLGVAQMVLANLFFTVCRDGAFGADVNMKVRLERLYEDYARWCRQHRIRSKLEMFTVDNIGESIASRSIYPVCG
jgi:hypothetical protein